MHKQFSGGKGEKPLVRKIKKASNGKEFPEEVSSHKTKKELLKVKILQRKFLATKPKKKTKDQKFLEKVSSQEIK